MNNAGYTEDLPEVVAMALAPLRSFGLTMESTMEDESQANLYHVGVVTSALADYAERRLADALAVVETQVGRISVGFDGHTSSIADNAMVAELDPAREAPGGDGGKPSDAPKEGEGTIGTDQNQA